MTQRKRFSAVLLVGSLVIGIACVAYPMYVIRPFRAQDPRELSLALSILSIRPALTLLCAIAAIAAVAIGWRAFASRGMRVLVLAGATLTGLAAVAARVNIFELMFHPLDAPSFVAVREAKLDADELLVTVSLNGVARGYPVRSIAYHHLVNDVVGGVPIVATY